MSPNKAEKFWDRMAGTFDREEKQFEKTRVRVIEKTKKHLHPGDTVLELGCATGRDSLEFAPVVKKIHGIDISSRMIEAARNKAADLRIDNAFFEKGELQDVSAGKGSFDVVLAFNILHLLEDGPDATRRISGLLKPGGLFVSVTPCLKEEMDFSNRFKLFLYMLVRKIGFIPIHVKEFRNPELEDLITGSGLEIMEAEDIYSGISSYFVVAKKKENLPRD